MLLRWLVSNFLRQAAEERLQQFVSEATGGPRGEPGDAADRAAGDGTATEGETAAPELPVTCDIACVFALGIESGGLVDSLDDLQAARYRGYKANFGQLGGRSLLVANTGVGAAAASRATRELIARHEPGWVVSAGFAGGLTPELKRGHLLMADRVVDTQQRHWNVGLKISADQLPRNVHLGTLLSVDRLVKTSQEKRLLAERHGAIACDMETAAVADVCREAKVRFLSVRIVSDSVEDQLPAEVEKLMDQSHWASKLGAATAAIWNRPSTVKDLWNLKQEALGASDRLAKFLVGVLAQLD